MIAKKPLLENQELYSKVMLTQHNSQEVTLQQIYTLKCGIFHVLFSQINFVGSETQLNNQKLSVKHFT